MTNRVRSDRDIALDALERIAKLEAERDAALACSAMWRAERDRLREVLERIANAGRGIPDWRSMSDYARAELDKLEP
jgi:hypothetical protein